MLEVIFSNIFLNLHEKSASEELESEEFLRCLWLRTDALMLLSVWDVIFV